MRSEGMNEALGGRSEELLAAGNRLAREIGIAMEAIAANDVEALEASVQRQVEQADQLRAARAELAAMRSPQGTASTANLTRDAARKLWTANEEYAALLSHAGKSLALIAALHGQAVAPDGRAGLSRSGARNWKG